MASASSSSPFFGGIRDEELQKQTKKQQQQQQQQSSSTVPAPAAGPERKRRNQPGNPNPDAEVIALSPTTLMATNRFICEVCNKGFQREQNLQLHRRGHNLPWKLRQKSSKEVRRRVYLCPEPTCVHHQPSRALGDLTGIKKHFCRKHGEKKWKCDKCSKRYAVQSDLKAHAKTCGTREYRCDCGTLFSRRDSFITHRAFCDALAQESSRPPTVGLHALGNHLYGNATAMASGLSQVNAHLSSLQAQSNAPTDLLRAGGRPGSQLEHLISSSTPSSFRPPQAPPPSAFYLDNGSTQDFNEEHPPHHALLQSRPLHGLTQLPDLQRSSTITSAATAAGVFDLGFFSHGSSGTSSIGNGNSGGNQNNRMLMADGFNSANGSTEPATLFSGNLMIDHVVGGTNSLYNTSMQSDWMLPQMSATALLQKAAQMGVTTSGGPSLLRGFARSSSSRCSFSGDGGDGGGGLQAQTENEAHLQNLMMTLANGGTDLFVGAGGRTAFGGSANAGVHQQQAGGFRALDTGLCVMDETKFDPSGARNLGGSDQLTRDFLGVGSMVRSISSGVTRREPI
ncbi:zinc finger protein [Musa troglodytarum]|uniref:Protein EARLY HEADING DATE 2 n=1 Tax=Musa troglodytarum TaxID=320322 RepID=A0A9E7EQB8_9LILI|nr:zinc finger protein [Musa troglodytarum]